MTKQISVVWLLALGTMLARGADKANMQKPSPINCVLNCRQDGQIVWASVTFSNATDTTIPVFLGVLLKEKNLEGTCFNVSLDGLRIPYRGIMVKRAAPGPDEFYHLKPGEVATSKVAINPYFDFSKPGKYVVQYASISASPAGTNLITIRSLPTLFEKK
jgi:hypothetical protein